ncbi:HAMP domain-containing sensor histidine kinase [Burkholderia sp. WP9]|uniref:sensor histidine kinase n=1 Tax=Burkholderia sp. WP9 TaxID=1500263 RepID=UPI003369E828
MSQRERRWRRATESDDRKGRFIATLAHELRNPLAPLTAGVKVLRSAVLPQERINRVLTIMERQLQGMVRLVDDMLDVARINRGVLEILPSWERLDDILDTAMSSCEGAIAARHQSVALNTERAPAEGYVDAVRLSQCLVNLVGNASKFSPEGSGIELVIERRANTVAFVVTDE